MEPQNFSQSSPHSAFPSFPRREFCAKSVLAALGLLGGGSSLLAQSDRSKIYTQAASPSDEALERLNLKLGWRAYLPIDDKRDGIYSVQIVDKELLVQTRAGHVLNLDSETGKVHWRTRIGTPYQIATELAYNSRIVLAVNNAELFGIDRATGRQLWHYQLPDALSAAPVMDEKLVYFTGSNRLYAFGMPGEELKDIADSRELTEPSGASRVSSLLFTAKASNDSNTGQPQPFLYWDFSLDTQVAQRPIQSSDFVLLAGIDGLVSVLGKGTGQREYRLPLESNISLPGSSNGELVYLPANDSNLYAINIVLGKILWRFTSGTPITRKPEVTNEDVFVTTRRLGLHRLKRSTGEVIWNAPKADQFLAVNPKFVYAVDSQGNLLVLDGQRGKELTCLNTRDFVATASNERTDRLYLAANNGLLICLHDRSFRSPVENRKPEEAPRSTTDKKPKPKPPKPESGKPADNQDKGGADKKDEVKDKNT